MQDYNSLKSMWEPAEKRYRGESGKSGSSGKRMRKFDIGHFVAWDGEGINTEPIDEMTTNSHMILFANSEGDILVSKDGYSRLTTYQCIRFIMGSANKYPDAIHVIYGGNWDFTHILRDLPIDKLQTLLQKSNSMFHRKINYRGYVIDYVPRRLLHLMKYSYRRNKEGKIERYMQQSVQIWDVVAFFQDTFVHTIEKWFSDLPPEYDIIRRGKDLRDTFNTVPLDFIIEYNNGELRVLRNLMQKFHDALKVLDLRLNRWDGAGALAASMLNKWEMKQHIPNDKEMPLALQQAALHAYGGGRVEDAMIGTHLTGVHNYDINSAYPHAMCQVPSLTDGQWIHHTSCNGEIDRYPGFSLVLVSWNLDPIRRFCPFHFRYKTGNILYPLKGKNWVWMPEIDAFLQTRQPRDEVIFHEAWSFYPDDATHFPFASMITYYYQYRQDIIKGKHPELPAGTEKVIKLGLNALYGKTAQNAGYNPEKKQIPPFHCIEYAGYITSFVRARLYRAAMHNPTAIICIATDGIFTTERLQLPISDTKVLGAWEYANNGGILILQSGLYVFVNDGKYKLRSRGVDRPESEDELMDLVERIRMTFRMNRYDVPKHKAPLHVQMTRFVTLRAALTSEAWHKRLGGWYTVSKQIDVHFKSSGKRSWDKRSSPFPSVGMCLSFPQMNLFAYGKNDLNHMPMSQQYVRPWDFDPEYYDDLEIGLESLEGIAYER